MQLLKSAEGRGKGGDPGGIRDEDAKGDEVGDEEGQSAEGIGGYVEFFEMDAGFERGRKGAEEVGGDVQGDQGEINLRKGRRQEGRDGARRARRTNEKMGGAFGT